MELFLFHYTAQPEVCYHDVCIFSRRSEEQVFGLEITMNDATVVDILDGLHDSPHQVGSVTMRVLRRLQDRRPHNIRFMVIALGTYPVKKLSATAQVEAKVQVVGCLGYRSETGSRNSM
jgi:hypothetical protein